MSIKLINVNKKFDDEIIFENFNHQFCKNEISCLLGSSGCGKTTLLNILAGLTKYQGNIEGASDDVSYIFQEPRLIESLTVYNNIDYVLRKKITDKNERDKQIKKYLSLVELYEWQNKYPDQLSGGMAQRVSMARAFAYPSDILLMDEAFNGLDMALKTRLVKVFLKLWNEDKRTVIMVTHDIYEALLLADTISIIKNKPAVIEFSERIDIEKSKRNLTDSNLTSIRDSIYSKFF